MKKFCIVTNRAKDKTMELTDRVVRFLEKHECECIIVGEYLVAEEAVEAYSKIPSDVDCCLVLGGDGTIIQTARLLSNKGIPILGINLGTLGFLSIIEQDEIEDALTSLLAGEYTIEKRIFADVRIECVDGTVRSTSAINDVVVKSYGMSRVISVEVSVNNNRVSTYTGDGILVSTPTGSTGYNLSAGGPIVIPEAELFVLTPVCPHSLNSRSIVVSENDRIVLNVVSGMKILPDEAMATIDGQEAYKLSAGDVITITSSKERAKLIRLNRKNFFDVLYRKLGE